MLLRRPASWNVFQLGAKRLRFSSASGPVEAGVVWAGVVWGGDGAPPACAGSWAAAGVATPIDVTTISGQQRRRSGSRIGSARLPHEELAGWVIRPMNVLVAIHTRPP